MYAKNNPIPMLVEMQPIAWVSFLFLQHFNFNISPYLILYITH
jgi:hypothetical protein